MIKNIIINSIVPVVFAFGSLNSKPFYKEKALKWLEEISAETNGISQKFAEKGIISKNASDTQAILELKTEYCDQRKCLDCAVGNVLLKRNKL